MTMGANVMPKTLLPSWSREWRSLSVDEKEIINRHTAQIPVKVSRICNDFGLEIVTAPLPARISGEIRPVDSLHSKFRIKINRYESGVRQRFTAAHELAHYLLHRNYIGSGVVDTVLYRSNLSSYLEAQANRLAADILMPINLIETYIRDRFTVHLDESDIEELSDTFQVSEVALRFRLGL